MTPDFSAAHKAPDARPQRRHLVERRVDRARVAQQHRRRADRGPVRPLGAGIAIPLWIGSDYWTAFVRRALARPAYRIGRRLCFVAAAIRIIRFVAAFDPRGIDDKLHDIVLR